MKSVTNRLPQCAQPDLYFCPYILPSVCGCQCEWCNISDLAMSTEARQSRQCMSQCPMIVPGALLRAVKLSSILALTSLKLLRIPILKGQALSFRPAAEDSLWLGTCFMREGLAIGVLLSSSFSFSKQQEWKDETESLYHTLQLLKPNWSKVLDASLLPCLRSTMSILRRNTGGKIHPSDIDEV